MTKKPKNRGKIENIYLQKGNRMKGKGKGERGKGKEFPSFLVLYSKRVRKNIGSSTLNHRGYNRHFTLATVWWSVADAITPLKTIQYIIYKVFYINIFGFHFNLKPHVTKGDSIHYGELDWKLFLNQL